MSESKAKLIKEVERLSGLARAVSILLDQVDDNEGDPIPYAWIEPLRHAMRAGDEVPYEVPA